MNDTAPEIAEEVRSRLEMLSNATRFKIGVEMFEAARRIIIASFPKDLSASQLKRRLYERVYGRALPF